VKAFSDQYQPLAKDLFGLSSLWLGGDHLVYVKGSGFILPFTEEYKRFRLSEIQAVNVAKTSRTGWILLYLFGLLLAILVVTLILVVAESMRPITVIGLSLGFALGLVSLGLLARHLILGPTCVCDIQTRLSRERIRPLNRYHRTLEMVRRIDGLVRDRQTDVRIGGDSDGRETSPRTSSARDADFFQVPRVVPASFGAFLLLGLGGVLGLHLESLGLTAFVLFMILAASLVLLLALIAVVRKPTPESLRTVLWLLLGLHFLVIGIGTVYYLVVATREPAYTVGLTGPLEAYAGIPSEGGMALYGVFAGLLGGMTGISFTGLLLAGKWRKKIRLAAQLEAASLNRTTSSDAV
jgi:hypothetical protein